MMWSSSYTYIPTAGSLAPQVPQQQTLLDLHHKTASTSLGIRRGTAPAGRSSLLGAAGAGLSTAGFVTNSGLVMQFDAYFKEAVDESPLENHRVRKCKILVYLEDSSVQIDECRQENSGMPQGTMVKRHQIPYPEVRCRSAILHAVLYWGCATIRRGYVALFGQGLSGCRGS